MRENVRNVSRGRAGRERWEFALDNRQVAAVVVGALVIVGSSFVLGINAGKSMARQAPKPVVANALDAFDAAHENLPTPPEPKSWEYEKLGGSRAPDASGATAQARVPPPARPLAPRPAQETPVATASPRPAPEPAETSRAAIAATVAAANAPAEHATPPASVGQHPAAATPPPVNTAPAARPEVATAAPRPAASAMDKAIAALSGPTTRSTPSAPPPAAKPATGSYVIQVGASPNRSEADRIAKRFASRGARVVQADVDGKRWYRVRLASMTYADRADAERALSRLSRETGARGFVTAAR